MNHFSLLDWSNISSATTTSSHSRRACKKSIIANSTWKQPRRRRVVMSKQANSHLASADWMLNRTILNLLVKRIEAFADELRIVQKIPHDPFSKNPIIGAFCDIDCCVMAPHTRLESAYANDPTCDGKPSVYAWCRTWVLTIQMVVAWMCYQIYRR